MGLTFRISPSAFFQGMYVVVVYILYNTSEVCTYIRTWLYGTYKLSKFIICTVEVGNIAVCINFITVNTAAAERLYSVIGDWCGVKDNTVLFG